MQRCLVVRGDKRYTVDEALNDQFFNNEQCKQDLKDLELRVGSSWIEESRENLFIKFHSQDSMEKPEPRPAIVFKSSMRYFQLMFSRPLPLLTFKDWPLEKYGGLGSVCFPGQSFRWLGTILGQSRFCAAFLSPKGICSVLFCDRSTV